MASLLMRRPGLSDLPECSEHVETASGADAAALGLLLSGAFNEDWDDARVHRDLLDDATVEEVYLIRDQDTVVATASARLLPKDYPGAGYLHWVASDPRVRGRGLGRAVTIAVLHRFAEDKLHHSVLETDDDRLAAITVYLGLGYVPQYPDDSHAERWSAIFRHLADHRRDHATGQDQ